MNILVLVQNRIIQNLKCILRLLVPILSRDTYVLYVVFDNSKMIIPFERQE